MLRECPDRSSVIPAPFALHARRLLHGNSKTGILGQMRRGLQNHVGDDEKRRKILAVCFQEIVLGLLSLDQHLRLQRRPDHLLTALHFQRSLDRRSYFKQPLPPLS